MVDEALSLEQLIRWQEGGGNGSNGIGSDVVAHASAPRGYVHAGSAVVGDDDDGSGSVGVAAGANGGGDDAELGSPSRHQLGRGPAIVTGTCRWRFTVFWKPRFVCLAVSHGREKNPKEG